jgi:hypothetical protein
MSEWRSANVTGVAGGTSSTPTMREIAMKEIAEEMEEMG